MTRVSAPGSAACSTIFENFKIANPDAQKQMEDMLARLGVIRDQHLGPAEQGSDPRDQRPRRRRCQPSSGAPAAARDDCQVEPPTPADRPQRSPPMPHASNAESPTADEAGCAESGAPASQPSAPTQPRKVTDKPNRTKGSSRAGRISQEEQRSGRIAPRGAIHRAKQPRGATRKAAVEGRRKARVSEANRDAEAGSGLG